MEIHTTYKHMNITGLTEKFQRLSWQTKILCIVCLIILSPIVFLPLAAILLISAGTPYFLIALIGLYAYTAYRYIWGTNDHKVRRFLISAAIFTTMLAFNVLDEYLNPTLPGPFMWAITDRPIDYPSTWGDNWRFWWIGVMLHSSLIYSTIITFILILVRKIVLFKRNNRSI